MNETVKSILTIFFDNRRVLHTNNCSIDCKTCYRRHARKIEYALIHNKPLVLILPAFPAKSANRDKTLSASPDFGEVLGLTQLNSLCQKIQALHSPGVTLVICSDGRVFNDLVLVSNDDVNQYQQGIIDIISKHRLSNLKTFCLDEVYPHFSHQQMRDALMQTYGEELSLLKSRLSVCETSKAQFNGIHRFLVEDQLVLRGDISKNKVRKYAKEAAYQVVLRSNAWSKLLQVYFPNAMRLSIHPQPCGSDKLGIHFIPTVNQWATPWHSVALYVNGAWQLVKKKQAEAMGAILNNDHYILEEAMG